MAGRGSPETVKRKELVGKLNPVCLQAFSAAAQAAKARGNPYVELVHFISALADTERSDFAILLDAAGVDRAQFDGELVKATGGKHGTVKDHLSRLVSAGHLTLHGEGRGAWYGLS